MSNNTIPKIKTKRRPYLRKKHLIWGRVANNRMVITKQKLNTNSFNTT